MGGDKAEPDSRNATECDEEGYGIGCGSDQETPDGQRS